jgi:small subunit ribosomal protein S10
MNTKNTSTIVASSKIVVKLFSYDHNLIKNAVFTIRNALSGSGVNIFGPVPIPTRKKTFTVNRSPHVDKKSREHFEIRTHIRVIELLNCNNIVIERLSKIALPNGVEIKIRYVD